MDNIVEINIEEIDGNYPYEVPQAPLSSSRSVILRSALEGEQSISNQHYMHLHLDIKQDLVQKLLVTTKPKTRKRSRFTPIKSIVTESLDRIFVTRSNINECYEDEVPEKLLQIWDRLVGADIQTAAYTKIMRVEKRVMDLILQNQDAFQDGLDWTKKGIDDLLPEHFTLSLYSSKWIVFIQGSSYKLSNDPSQIAAFKSNFVSWLEKANLSKAIICVQQERSDALIFIDCEPASDRFQCLSEQEIKALRFENYKDPKSYIWRYSLEPNKIICVPSGNEPQQLALVWTDEINSSTMTPGRIRLKTDSQTMYLFGNSTYEPSCLGDTVLESSCADESTHYQELDESDFNFLGEKQQAAFTWYKWHSKHLEPFSSSLGLLIKQVGVRGCLAFLKMLDDLYMASPSRHKFFVALFLQNTTDWLQFFTSDNRLYIQRLGAMKDSEFIWCETLFRQHAQYNSSISFSELMASYLDFLCYLEAHDLLTYLPKTCGITQFKHIKPMLFRLKTILSHADDPKQQLQYVNGLDFGLYGAYYYAADPNVCFEILTEGMNLSPSGFSTNHQELCYILKSDDSFSEYVNAHHENYSIVSAVYHRILANYNDRSQYRRLFDYDLYCYLENIVLNCKVGDTHKSNLLYFVFRHTRGDVNKYSPITEVQDPNDVAPALINILEFFGALQSEVTSPSKFFALDDIFWINDFVAHYGSRDDMPSLPFMYKILCLVDTALHHIETDVNIEIKQRVLNLLINSATLGNRGIDKYGIALLLRRINSTSSTKQLKLYLGSYENSKLGLLDIVLGFFKEPNFFELINDDNTKPRALNATWYPASDMHRYASQVSQLLMCVKVDYSDFCYDREELISLLVALTPYKQKFYITERLNLNLAFLELLKIFRTINFTHSPLPTIPEMIAVIVEIVDAEKDFVEANLKSDLGRILRKNCPFLIFDNIDKCDWNFPFNIDKLKENEHKLGINNEHLSSVFSPDNIEEVIELGCRIELVQKYYANHVQQYRIFLDAVQACALTSKGIIIHVNNLIKYCVNSQELRLDEGVISSATTESDGAFEEHYLAIFPELCYILIAKPTLDWFNIFKSLFVEVQQLKSLSLSQRSTILIFLSNLYATDESSISLAKESIAKINMLASDYRTRELAMSLLVDIKNALEYVEKIFSLLNKHHSQCSELSRLFKNLIKHIAEYHNQDLLNLLLDGRLSEHKVRVFCFYHAQHLPFKDLYKLYKAFCDTALLEDEWNKLFNMPPYPSYDFILALLQNQDRESALEKIRLFDLEPNGIKLDNRIFQISSEEKLRLMRVFSKINQLTQQTPIDFSMQKKLLQDYLTITISYGPKFCQKSRGELKKLWDTNNQNLKLESHGKKDIVLQQMAIMREVYRRISGKFPYCTQMLILLYAEEVPGNELFQLETGEGKSIVMALMAVWLYRKESKSVYIASRNRDLGQQDYIDKKTREFIRAFDIFCPEDLIEPTLDNHCEFPGIYYFSSAAGLSLMQSLQQFSNNLDFFNANLIIDEVDDTALNDLTSFNVTINTPQLQAAAREKAWIYRHINTFYDQTVKFQPELLKDDILLTQFLRDKLMKSAPSKTQKTFIQELSHEELLVFFLAANTATCFQEGKDYVLKQVSLDLWRAVPLRKGEPQMQSLFSDNLAHSCLHARLQQNMSGHEFEILPETVYIGSASAKAIFDRFQEQKSRIIGLTATAGTFEECLELRTKYQMNVLHIPPYNANKRITQPTLIVHSSSAVLEKIQSIIQSNTHITKGRQPFLIYCENNKVAKSYFEVLKERHPREIQLINGEETEEERARMIKQADADNMITVTTLLLLRGFDYQPNGVNGKEKGSYLIQTFLANPRDTVQVKGRVARNGAFGTYQLLLNDESLPFWNEIKIYPESERLAKASALINDLEAIQRNLMHLMDDERQALLKKQDSCFLQLGISSNKKANWRQILLKKLDLLWSEALKNSDPNGDYVNNVFCRYHDGKFEKKALEEALEQFKITAFEYWKIHYKQMIDESLVVLPDSCKYANDSVQLPSQLGLFDQKDEQCTPEVERFATLQLEMIIDDELVLQSADKEVLDKVDFLFDIHTNTFIQEYNNLLKNSNAQKNIFDSFWTVRIECLPQTKNATKNLEQFVTAMRTIKDEKLRVSCLPILLKLHFFAKKYRSKIDDNTFNEIEKLTSPLVNTITLYLTQTLSYLNWYENKYTWYYWFATQAIKDIARDIGKYKVNSAEALNTLDEKLKQYKYTLQQMYFQWFLWGHQDTLNCINNLQKQVEILKTYDQEIDRLETVIQY